MPQAVLPISLLLCHLFCMVSRHLALQSKNECAHPDGCVAIVEEMKRGHAHTASINIPPISGTIHGRNRVFLHRVADHNQGQLRLATRPWG